MTNLSNLLPENSYGDLLTTTNGGQGLGETLQPVQDGLGRNSPLQMSQNAVQFSNIMSIPVWTTATRPNEPLNASLGLNTDTMDIEFWDSNADTWTSPGRASPQTAKAWGYVQPDGTLISSFNVSAVALANSVYTVTLEHPMSSADYCIISGVSFRGGLGRVRQFSVTDQQAGQFSFEILDVTGDKQTDTYSYFAVFAEAYG